MIMKRQHWAVVLIAVLVVSMALSGCGKKATPQPTPTPVPTKAMPPSPTAAPPTKAPAPTKAPTAVPPTKAPPTKAPPTPSKPGMLRMNWCKEPVIDPSLASDPASVNVVSNLFMSLTRLDPKSGKAIPYLAEKWESSSDGLTWTFHMRKGVKWVSYDPKTGKAGVVKDYSGKERAVTAGDVVFGIQRTLDPLTKSPYADALDVIKNVEAADDFTVKFTLEKPVDYFPELMGLPGAMPQPEWAIDAWHDNWTEPGMINTNGPYMLANWKHGFELDLVKNPDWFDADKVQIAKVYGVIVNTPGTLIEMYKANELDVLSLAPPLAKQVKEMKDLAKAYREAPGKEGAPYASYYPRVRMLAKPWVNVNLPVLGGYNIFEWTVDVSKQPSGG